AAQYVARPPEISNTPPVLNEHSSEASHATSAAISVVCPNRPIGMRESIYSIWSSDCLSIGMDLGGSSNMRSTAVKHLPLIGNLPRRLFACSAAPAAPACGLHVTVLAPVSMSAGHPLFP